MNAETLNTVCLDELSNLDEMDYTVEVLEERLELLAATLGLPCCA